MERVAFEQSARHAPKASVEATHVHVGCDLTLTRATGVVGLDLSYGKIDGSIYLHGPLQQPLGRPDGVAEVARARCQVSGRLEMRSMTIGGDADLLFSSQPSPANGEPFVLNLRYTTVGGALSIFPSIQERPGATKSEDDVDVRLSGKQYGRRLMYSGAKQKSRRLLNPLKEGLKSLLATDDDSGDLDPAGRPLTPAQDNMPEILRHPACAIDLRNVVATVFRHPPSAWPQRNGLQISQFKYETSGSSGPLGVLPDPSGGMRRDRNLWPRLLALTLGTIGVGGVAALLWSESRNLVTSLDEAGRVNLALLWALMSTVLVLQCLRLFVQPRGADLKPMGAFWLSLQQRLPNPFRTNAWYLPTEPYLVAANALRADGKLRSADLVELERARVRRKTLSFRHHFLAQGGLKLLDFVAHYGFNISRAVFGAMFAVTILACIFEGAHHAGFVQPADKKAPTPAFRSFAYAVDLFIPVIDTGDAAHWRVVVNDEPAARKMKAEAPRLWWAAVEVSGACVWLAQILGFMLTAVVGASLAARTESFLSRIQQ